MERMCIGMTRKHESDRSALLEDVAAESAESRDAVGQVHFLGFLEALPL